MNTRNITVFFCICILALRIGAQGISLPKTLPQGHPRLLTTIKEKKATLKTIEKEEWARDTYKKLKERTDVYINKVEEQPDWLYSRLQMYWKTHSTEVYINGEQFDHAGGTPAPEPTVRFCGTRGTTAQFTRPKLEDIVPYDDDEQNNVTYRNKTVAGEPMEKVHPSKTGCNITNVNRQIMGIARDAAFIYYVSGDKRYAEMAAKVFDVFMAGLYYRNAPIDINHGHQATLVGLTSFEVIHEDVVNEATETYDFLYDYLSDTRPQRMDIYSSAFKKWADIIIANGVPHNNWNLFQATFVMRIAMILNDDKSYTDGRGRRYYIDYLLNKSSIRQWSLTQLAEYGFDMDNGIWTEAPGYSQNVVCDYADMAALLDRTIGIDLIAQMPILKKAAASTPQYLFPNRMICGFGDTHPNFPRTSGIARMIEYAQKHGLTKDEEYFTAMLKAIDPNAGHTEQRSPAVAVSSFFAEKPLTLNAKIAAGDIARYVSPTFHAPKVSWLVLRNGMDKQNSLMISLNGSKGNHQHANGISMELYGKGYVLGPDGGIGKSLYSGLDYAEYYSQFPAHNTVCVDGVSSYPVMMSQHAFRLRSCFPTPQTSEETKDADPTEKYSPLTFSEVYFREPETQADQVRTNGIVSIGETGGYYVDIFRSRRADGCDKMHDYFYHNLGQQMTLVKANGDSLNLHPTDELAFAGGHLYAYSYIYNKMSAKTDEDVKATFTTTKADGQRIEMNMWMNGENGREVFKALSPENEEYNRMPGQPYKLKDSPVLTFVARQTGEAWNHPFVAVYEPSATVNNASTTVNNASATVNEASMIANVSFFDAISTDTVAQKSFAGICVKTKAGRTDYIFSAYNPQSALTYQDMSVCGTYAVISDDMALLGNGVSLTTPHISITSRQPVSVLLIRKNGKWTARTTGDCCVTVDGQPICR